MINLKLQCIIYSAFLIISNSAHAEETIPKLSIEKLKETAQSIEKTERCLLNIKIDSEAWVERGPSLSGPWQRSPVYLSSTAFFNGLFRNKARLDIHKIVLEWKNGTTPQLEKNYSVSFDGQHGRYVYNSTSHSGKVFNINKYSISPDVPYELSSKWWHKMTGINASLNFHFNNEPWGFSDYFQKAAEPNFALGNAELEFIYQKLNGTECVKMSAKGKRFQKSWWLDPTRGFALLRHENTRIDKNGNEVVVDLVEVRKLDKVAENIWWPVEVYFVSSPSGVGNPWERIVYHATSVVANDPNFDDSIFTVPIPEGYSIDEAEYKTIYTGHATEQ